MSIWGALRELGALILPEGEVMSYRCPECGSENVWVEAYITVNPNEDSSQLDMPDWNSPNPSGCNDCECEFLAADLEE